jgi:transposase
VFCCPHCGLIADRDAQAAKYILGHGLSVLRELDPDLHSRDESSRWS